MSPDDDIDDGRPPDEQSDDDEDSPAERPAEVESDPTPEDSEPAEEADDASEMAEYDPETGERLGGDDQRSETAVGENGQKYCHACGTQIAAGAKYCPDCGAEQGETADAGETDGSRDVDRVTAGIFAILLGGLGVHHFYLGNVGLGVLYLCFSWTFIPALVGVIEGIIYLTKTDEEFQQRYGSG